MHNTQTVANMPGLVLPQDVDVTQTLDYIVKGFLRCKQVGMLLAGPGIGKSTLGAYIGSCIAAGTPIGNFKVRKTVVLWVTSEDPAGCIKRAKAHLDDETDIVPFAVQTNGVDMLNREQVAGLKTAMLKLQQDFGIDRGLFMIDTLNRSIGDADENAAGTANTVVTAASQLGLATNSAVLFMHHPNLSDPSRPRGSSAWLGSLDCVFLLEKLEHRPGQPEVVKLVPTKLKNDDPFGELFFEKGQAKLGVDREGDPITAPICTLTESSSLRHTEKAKEINPAELVYEVLEQLNATAQGTAVSIAQIEGSIGPDICSTETVDSRKKAIGRALKELEEAGSVDVLNGSPKTYRIRPSRTAPAAHTASSTVH